MYVKLQVAQVLEPPKKAHKFNTFYMKWILRPHATTAMILFNLIYWDLQQTTFMLISCSKFLLCAVSCWQDLAINIRAVVDSCGRLRMGTVGVY